MPFMAATSADAVKTHYLCFESFVLYIYIYIIKSDDVYWYTSIFCFPKQNPICEQ